jgi:1-pyrroline-5-carboxylate dehydrogenase
MHNEPVFPYAPGDKTRDELQKQLKNMLAEKIEIPVIIGGKAVHSGKKVNAIAPHDHRHVLAEVHEADEQLTLRAIDSALAAKTAWENTSFNDRAAVFLKAADLLAAKYRPILNASTMLNQSKNPHQAEIDAACEMIDFFRFNVEFAKKIQEDQPISSPGVKNSMEYRPLEGFVVAITPFNFTSIAGNLPTSAALMGNTVVWKPSHTSLYSGYFIMKLLEEAGLPPGVINYLPGPSSKLAPTLFGHRDFAGIHFTGSTKVFQNIWQTIGENISGYKSYPRIVGETGGKDFVFVHASAGVKEVATGLVRGAFEYQGQKCSAASRAYVPKSLWPEIKNEIGAQLSEMKMGDVTDFSNFINAVIDEKSFDNLSAHIEKAKKSSDTKIVFGGKCDKSKGYFIEPTVIETKNPKYATMCEELFGPVLSVYVYDDKDLEATLELCDTTSPYALTGAVFAKDPKAIAHVKQKLKHAAGNFYINDKPTGAVVGQQPFGGARASGTNDKAGSMWNLIRWVSPRTIKETFDPPTNFRYPFLG